MFARHRRMFGNLINRRFVAGAGALNGEVVLGEGRGHRYLHRAADGRSAIHMDHGAAQATVDALQGNKLQGILSASHCGTTHCRSHRSRIPR